MSEKWKYDFFIQDFCHIINGNHMYNREYAMSDPMYRWLKLYIKNDWRFLIYICAISFENDIDAMAFKLRWL